MPSASRSLRQETSIPQLRARTYVFRGLDPPLELAATGSERQLIRDGASLQSAVLTLPSSSLGLYSFGTLFLFLETMSSARECANLGTRNDWSSSLACPRH